LNFEAKDLIKWGIPGWIFLTGAIAFIVGIDHSILKQLKEYNMISIVFVSVGLGVPIGYVFNQTYFAFSWIIDIKKKGWLKEKYKPVLAVLDKKGFSPSEFLEVEHKKSILGSDLYFYIEAIWFQMLADFKNENEQNQRQYISKRYAYYLRKIHGLGVLIYSLISLIFFNILTLWVIWKLDRVNIGNLDFYGVVFAFIVLVVFVISSLMTYNYYSRNLIAFQTQILKKWL
jgi:hypothetical protein